MIFFLTYIVNKIELKSDECEFVMCFSAFSLILYWSFWSLITYVKVYIYSLKEEVRKHCCNESVPYKHVLFHLENETCRPEHLCDTTMLHNKAVLSHSFVFFKTSQLLLWIYCIWPCCNSDVLVSKGSVCLNVLDGNLNYERVTFIKQSHLNTNLCLDMIISV